MKLFLRDGQLGAYAAAFLPVLLGIAVLIAEYAYLYTEPVPSTGPQLPAASLLVVIPVADDDLPDRPALPAGTGIVTGAQTGAGFGDRIGSRAEPEAVPAASRPARLAAAGFWRRAGYASYRQGRWQQARQAYRQVLRLMPLDGAARHNLTVISSGGTRPEQLSVDTPSRRFFQQGNASARQGDWRQASRDYQRACRLSSDAALLADCLFNWAVSAEQQGAYRLALHLYGRATGIEGDFPAVSRQRAVERARLLWRFISQSPDIMQAVSAYSP